MGKTDRLKALVFPGQGSQAKGMGVDLKAFPAAQDKFTKAEQILGWSVLEICQNCEDKLSRTLYTQPCLYVVQSILADLLLEQGLCPDLVAGHSLGEYVALYAARVFDFETGLSLVKRRAELMDNIALGGVMVALVNFDRKQLEQKIQETADVVVASDNSAGQVVISGTLEAVDAVLTEVTAEKIVRLNTSGAFHSPLMAEASAEFEQILETVVFADAQIPILSNVDPEPAIAAPKLKDRLIRQMMGCVQWREICLKLEQAGIEQVLEVGPGRVLTGLIKHTCPNIDLKNINGLADLTEVSDIEFSQELRKYLNANGLLETNEMIQDKALRFVPPQDALEFNLTKIWEKVLGVQPIGVRDNFFELGGNSLVAVRLFAEIERIWSRNLPLATLFQTPTVEELAGVLRQEESSSAWSSLVPIQPNGSKPPLFCIHPIGGSILEYYPLSSHLDKEQPVYGLQAQGFDDKQAPLVRVEDMAGHYITEIRTIQPKGPYFLVGYSFGGVIAFEMAQQLYAQGDKVALLALLDTKCPKLPITRPSLAESLIIHLNNLLQLGTKEKFNYFKDRINYHFTNLNYKDFVIRELSKTENITDQYLKVLESNIQASKDYIPQVYPDVVHLFRSQVQPVNYAFNDDLGWRKVAGNLEIDHIPGQHFNMMKGRYVLELAEKLKLCLEKV
jgi:malonyl CoA-acyl carrier protein transacylase